MKNLIQKLVEANGPSGYEQQVRELVRTEIEPMADELKVDALGNLLARKGQKDQKGLRVILSAHIDEIGVIATFVDEKGFVRFTSIGGVSPRTCLGSRVRFIDGTPGVIGSEKTEPYDKMPSFDQLFIDVGASSRSDCKVSVGDIAVFDRPFIAMENRLVSKAMDDRIGAAVLIEVLRQLKRTPHEIFYVFSVQEEVGLRGATTAAYQVNAELGLAVDVTLSADTPKGIKMQVSLGEGPAIKVRDGGMLSDPRVVQQLINSAQKARLPYQLEVLESGTTDARAIQLTREGIPTGCVSIPCRYIHSPSEMVDFRDVENAVKLIVEYLSKPIEFK